MSKILIVDDDPHIRELVRVFLQNEGFEIYEAADGKEALEKLEMIKADLVILDVMMPRMDGWQLCRELREFYDLPLLMLTAKGETSQKIKGFHLGTDDYLVKPFEPLELVVRVKALLRRYQIASSQSVQIGELSMNRKTHEINVGDKKPTLPLKEFELLFKLASYPGHTISREQLIEDIWGYDFAGNERTLDVHINRLRERFPEEQHSFTIKTIRGLGYTPGGAFMIRKILRRYYLPTFTLAMLTGCFLVVFFITSYFYKEIGMNPSSLIVQIVNFFISLFLAFFIMYLVRSKLLGRD